MFPIPNELERCDAEIARCKDYLRSGDHEEFAGAYLGLHDWQAEKRLLMAESKTYEAFLQSKAQHGEFSGFEPIWMPSFLRDFQSSLVDWSIRKGKDAILADCGMGKTPMQLVWAENIVRKTNRPVLIATPLAVAQQTIREANKFGIEAKRTNDGTVHAGINVTNYERLHYYEPNDFAGFVGDEASSIKSFNGKRRVAVTEFMRTLPYRLLCTATGAPNDYIELGTMAEALGVMGYVDMLNRFFKNDQNTSDTKSRWTGFAAPRQLETPGWRFKGHAEIPFFRWVCSWARGGRKPSDFGPFSDTEFKLPKLIEREHIVETRTMADGMLFPLPAANWQEEREERRRTINERCEMAAGLVANTKKPFVVWCHLNPEGDLLEKIIPDAIQVSGADSDEAKEEAYEAFVTGQSRGLVTKSKIGGWGLNWQHCAHVLEFASHSFEQHYQGVRRCWRFGQTSDVINDMIVTEGERGAQINMKRKSDAADRMFTHLVENMHVAQKIEAGYKFTKEVEVPAWL